MTQPTPYNRGFSFTDYQASTPSAPVPGYRLDAELDGIAGTLDGVLGNLALIQRDDGKLQDGVVTTDAVSADLLLAIAAAAPPGPTGDDGLSAYDVAVANGFVGTQAAWLLSLRGTGDPGDQGDPGADAVNPAFTFAVTTLAPGSNATLNVTGAYPNQLLTFGVPRGATGAGGGGGALADLDYGDVNVTGAGTSMVVQTVLGGSVPSVVGHTHVIGDVTGLQGALDGKAAAAHTHTIANVTGLQAALDGKQPTGNYLILSDLTWNNIGGKPATFPPSAHTHPIADVTGLQAALDGKQPAGTYVDASAIAGKADAITSINSFATSQTVSDATHNGCYNIMTGATTRTLTFGSTPAAGHCSIWVSRGTGALTIACPGGYWKDGAFVKVTSNFNLGSGSKMTAFHEGGGNWSFEVVG